MLQRICRLTFEPIDEEIEVLHGKDGLCLRAGHIAVIGMNPLRRTCLPCRHAKNFPRLLAEARRKKLLEVTWKPHKHDFSRPCTHTIVPFPIRSVRHKTHPVTAVTMATAKRGLTPKPLQPPSHIVGCTDTFSVSILLNILLVYISYSHVARFL